jgi:DNA-binding transcriptional LysR family regulator
MPRTTTAESTEPSHWLAWAAFAMAAEKRSLAAAARALDVHPATMTRLLDALDAELGVALLQRTNRGCQTTTAGLRALPHAQALLARAREAVRRAAGGERLALGPLRVWAPGPWVRARVMPELPGFFDRHPGLWLDLRTGQADRFDSSNDIVVDTVVRDSNLPAWQRPVAVAPFVGAAAARAGLGLATGLPQLLGAAHVLLDPLNGPLPLLCEGEMVLSAFAPARLTVVDDAEFAMVLAAAGDAVAWLPSHLAPPASAAGAPPALHRLPGAWQLGRGVQLHCSTREPAAASTEAMVELLAACSA